MLAQLRKLLDEIPAAAKRPRAALRRTKDGEPSSTVFATEVDRAALDELASELFTRAERDARTFGGRRVYVVELHHAPKVGPLSMPLVFGESESAKSETPAELVVAGQGTRADAMTVSAATGDAFFPRMPKAGEPVEVLEALAELVIGQSKNVVVAAKVGKDQADSIITAQRAEIDRLQARVGKLEEQLDRQLATRISTFALAEELLDGKSERVRKDKVADARSQMEVDTFKAILGTLQGLLFQATASVRKDAGGPSLLEVTVMRIVHDILQDPNEDRQAMLIASVGKEHWPTFQSAITEMAKKLPRTDGAEAPKTTTH